MSGRGAVMLVLMWGMVVTVSATEGGSQESNPVPGSDANWVVPEAPAFTALGVLPSQVTIPSSPRELALALTNGVGETGRLQQGMAIDTTPYLLWAGPKLMIVDYRKNYITRLLTRTDLSLATTKGQEAEDPAFRAAVGLRMTLFDYGDARLDLNTDSCLAKATAFPSSPPSPNENDNLLMVSQREDLLKKMVDGCHRESLKRNWNRSAMDVAVVPIWIDTSGGSSSLKSGGTIMWSSIAYGFEGVPMLERNAQLIFLVRRDSDRVVPDSNNAGQYISQDSWNGGLRVRYGGENAVLNVEFVRTRVEPHGAEAYDADRYSIGADIRVGEELWLNLSTGRKTRSDGGEDQSFVNTGLRWGFSSKPAQDIQ